MAVMERRRAGCDTQFGRGSDDAIGRCFHEERERLVGQGGEAAGSGRIPRITVYSIKRFMGRKYDEVAHEISLVPYEVVRAKNGDVHVKIGNDTIPPRDLVHDPAEAEGGCGGVSGREDHAGRGHRAGVFSMTVSARRRKIAGRIGAWKCCASSTTGRRLRWSYGLDKKKDEAHRMCMTWGRTFDISALDIGEGVFEVKATNGDTPPRRRRF